MSKSSADTVTWDAIWTIDAGADRCAQLGERTERQAPSDIDRARHLGIEVVLRLKITLQIFDVVPPRWILSHAAGGHHDCDQRNCHGTSHRAKPCPGAPCSGFLHTTIVDRSGATFEHSVRPSVL